MWVCRGEWLHVWLLVASATGLQGRLAYFMKRLALLAVALLTPVLASAQVDIACRLINGRVLQFEPVLVWVEISNRSFQPLRLSSADANALLTFDVEQGPGLLVPPTEVPLPSQPVTIAPGETWKAAVNILPAYPLRRTGPYTVATRLDWNEKAFVSGKMFLDVVPGLELMKLVSGIPGDASVTRTYSLRTLSRDRKERLFLRIDDEDQSECYGVLDLGSIVRMFTPVMQVDGVGNIHILHQSGPWQYARHVFTPNGEPLSQETYVGEGGQVQMEQKPSGQIVVKGAEVYTGGGEGGGGSGGGAQESDEVPEPDAADGFEE